jgi:hypothetical protein
MDDNYSKCEKGVKEMNENTDFCDFINIVAKLISLLAGCDCKK